LIILFIAKAWSNKSNERLRESFIILNTLEVKNCITQPYPDVRDRLNGVLLECEAIAGLEADPPPSGPGGFLMDGC